jgi:transcriptional antiterminator NusG
VNEPDDLKSGELPESPEAPGQAAAPFASSESEAASSGYANGEPADGAPAAIEPPEAHSGTEAEAELPAPAPTRTSRARTPRKATRHVPLPIQEDEPPGKMEWYILKVQSNREDSIRDALLRNVKIAGKEEFFGEIIVPKEQVSEFKGGKKRVVKRKLYPGYIVVNMILNDETRFLVRETSGIGDFTGSGDKPSPMPAHEINRIIKPPEDKAEEGPKLKINFSAGDRVKVTAGTFENFEGEVHAIDQANGRVTVMINIFGRSTPVEIDYWEIEGI